MLSYLFTSVNGINQNFYCYPGANVINQFQPSKDMTELMNLIG